jgi:hypothetical protein
MIPDLRQILAGKQAYRELLAALPIAEKLRMLEALRDRSLEIAAAREGMRDQVRPGSQPPSA